MTDTVLSATLFGAEDLRLVEAPLGPLTPAWSGCASAQVGSAGRTCITTDMVGPATSLSIPLTLVTRSPARSWTSPLTAGSEIGDRVAVNPSRWCGHCARCQEGRPNLCENIYFMGSASKTPHMQGGFATYFDAIPAQCVKVSDSTPIAAAALAEPLAVCLHAISRAGQVEGRKAIVFGAGPIGLLTFLAARLAGVSEVAMVDVAAAPLAFAQRLGADHTVDISGGEGALKELAKARSFDLAFEVSGTAAGLSSAISNVRRGGTVVQIGNLPGGQIPVPANAVMAKEIDLKGSFRFGEEFEQAVRLIDDRMIDVLSIVTSECPLSEATEGFRAA